MKEKGKTLLLIDAIVNLLLGTILLLYPFGVAQLAGVPEANTYFYRQPVLISSDRKPHPHF